MSDGAARLRKETDQYRRNLILCDISTIDQSGREYSSTLLDVHLRLQTGVMVQQLHTSVGQIVMYLICLQIDYLIPHLPAVVRGCAGSG